MTGSDWWWAAQWWVAVGRGGWLLILAVNSIFLHLLCPMLLDSVPDLTPPPKKVKESWSKMA